MVYISLSAFSEEACKLGIIVISATIFIVEFNAMHPLMQDSQVAEIALVASSIENGKL